MSSAYWVTGDTRAVTAQIPDGSIDCIITSPPFLALRSYLAADHPDKALEIGSEATPAAFLDVLLDLTVEWRRILAPHGSICIELGDTYSGSGGAGGDYSEGGLREGQPAFRQVGSREHRPLGDPKRGYTTTPDPGLVPLNGGRGWPLAKSLCGIPALYTNSLAYGRNLLNPAHEIEPWRIRNVVRWCRPNPPVGALGDKFRPATSEMTVACVSGSRWFDLDAVRMPVTEAEWAKAGQSSGESYQGTAADGDGYDHVRIRQPNAAGAPPLDYWEIPTQPYKGSHYATWPERLLVRPILSMCPERVCRVCGEPSRRIVDVKRLAAADDSQRTTKADEYRLNAHNHAPEVGWEMSHETVGWSECGHDDWRPGRVLDPFAGSGTTLQVAVGHGRDAIGVDLDPRNLELARERVGPMFLVETKADDLPALLGPSVRSGGQL